MDSLTTELLSMVVGHLYDKSPPPLFLNPLEPPASRLTKIPYACVSRKWQDMVEAYNFVSMKLKSTELDTFASIYSGLRRRSILRRLEYSVTLPTYGDSRHDHAANLTAFRAAVRSLFVLLTEWDKDDDNHGGLEISLVVEFNVDTSQGPAEFDFNVVNSSANARYLTLDEVSLPVVRRITGLAVTARPGLAPHPTTMCQLAAKTPRLQKLTLEYLDPVNKRKSKRKEHRLAFAAGLDALNLPELTHLHIQRLSTTEPYNHNFNCGDLEEHGIDRLNVAIRSISQRSPLKDLHLEDTLISADLFRQAIWPTLQRFTIKAGLVSPSGQWYYTGDPTAVEPGFSDPGPDSDGEQDSDDDDSRAGSSDEDDDADRESFANGTRPSHAWRTHPDPEVFNPLILDMSDAVLRMPRLEEGHLEMSTNYGDPIGVVIKCAETGQTLVDRPDWEQDEEEEKRTRRWQVWIGTATEWVIPSEVEHKWRSWLGPHGKIIRSRYPPTY